MRMKPGRPWRRHGAMLGTVGHSAALLACTPHMPVLPGPEEQGLRQYRLSPEEAEQDWLQLRTAALALRVGRRVRMARAGCCSPRSYAIQRPPRADKAHYIPADTGATLV